MRRNLLQVFNEPDLQPVGPLLSPAAPPRCRCGTDPARIIRGRKELERLRKRVTWRKPSWVFGLCRARRWSWTTSATSASSTGLRTDRRQPAWTSLSNRNRASSSKSTRSSPRFTSRPQPDAQVARCDRGHCAFATASRLIRRAADGAGDVQRRRVVAAHGEDGASNAANACIAELQRDDDWIELPVSAAELIAEDCVCTVFVSTVVIHVFSVVPQSPSVPSSDVACWRWTSDPQVLAVS